MFLGQSLRVRALNEPGLFEVCFDRVGEAINKLDQRTVDEFRHIVDTLSARSDLRGVLVTSAKDAFIVGADITEFGAKFSRTAEEIATDLAGNSQVFTAFEDMPVPTVIAINGYALGGGLEMALAGAVRVMSTAARIGVPEVKLGIYPGYGGTVRLSRLAGPPVACRWVATGAQADAAEALSAGVVDAVEEPAALRSTAMQWLQRCVSGEVDWAQRQQRKREAVRISREESEKVFASALELAERGAPRLQPAAATALTMMAEGASMSRDDALRLEIKVLGELARTQAAASLTQTFLSEQAVKKRAKGRATGKRPVQRAVVLGAGIMGGGIAYTSALIGVPVIMKDVRQQALDLGMAEAEKLVAREVKATRFSMEKAASVLRAIEPQLDHRGFDTVSVVVEAIVENLDVKRQVLGELESLVKDDTIIASNTSSLLIDDIGARLNRRENFVGMHFFNPVHIMPLVEIVRGSHTSDAAVATAVGYALAMGKTPIVVKDCPGFLVNRLFTAYMRAFLQLVADGVDFEAVDRAMEAFGWPMGPAYLEDVIGIDTGSHVNDVISAGYPQRMPALADDALRVMARHGRYGQKNGLGFYRYEPNPRGKPIRVAAQETRTLLATLQTQGKCKLEVPEIQDRMMLPMIVEAAHALEEGVVETPAELDMAMLLGLGFPAYAGGPLTYADWLGMPEIVARCERLRNLGAAFEPTARMRDMARRGETYYQHAAA